MVIHPMIFYREVKKNQYHHPLTWRKFTKTLESPVNKILDIKYLAKIMAQTLPLL